MKPFALDVFFDQSQGLFEPTSRLPELTFSLGELCQEKTRGKVAAIAVGDPSEKLERLPVALGLDVNRRERNVSIARARLALACFLFKASDQLARRTVSFSVQFEQLTQWHLFVRFGQDDRGVAGDARIQ